MSAQRTTVATFPQGLPIAGLPYLVAAMEYTFGEHVRIDDESGYGEGMLLFSQGERLTDEQMDARLEMMRDYAAQDSRTELQAVHTVDPHADVL